MKDFHRIVKLMVKEYIVQMDMYMMVIGWMIKNMEKVQK